MSVQTRFIRPVLAWLLVCLLAAVIMAAATLLVVMLGAGVQSAGDGALTGAAGMAAGLGFFVFLTVAVVTALPWLFICWGVHLTSAPRGTALPLAAGLLGVAVWFVPVVTQSGFSDLAGRDAVAAAFSGAVGIAGGWLYARLTRPSA